MLRAILIGLDVVALALVVMVFLAARAHLRQARRTGQAIDELLHVLGDKPGGSL